jgi:hypothetical protein
MSSDLSIEAFLTAEGYGHDEALEAAVQALIAAGLTRPGKRRIADTKVEAARAALRARLIVTCAAARCIDAARAAGGRLRVPAASRDACEVCSGSDNAQAVDAMVRLALARRISRILVIGGSPGTREQLAALVGRRLELKTIDGTVRRTAAQAREDFGWAQLVVVWGATELAHKVSLLYTRPGARPAGRDVRVIVAPRRGIAALATSVGESLSRER